MPRTGGISIHAQKIFWCPLANSRAQSFLKNLRIHVAHRRYCIHQKNDSFFNHLVLLNLLKKWDLWKCRRRHQAVGQRNRLHRPQQKNWKRKPLKWGRKKGSAVNERRKKTRLVRSGFNTVPVLSWWLWPEEVTLHLTFTFYALSRSIATNCG